MRAACARGWLGCDEHRGTSSLHLQHMHERRAVEALLPERVVHLHGQTERRVVVRAAAGRGLQHPPASDLAGGIRHRGCEENAGGGQAQDAHHAAAGPRRQPWREGAGG